MNKKNGGLSIVELVFSIGFLVLVISGVVVLIVNSIAMRSRGFDRKKAASLGELVMEELVESKRSSPSDFWSLNTISRSTKSGFEGYVYSVGYTEVVDASIGCGVAMTNCVEAVVSVGWSGDVNQTMTFNRFFYRL